MKYTNPLHNGIYSWSSLTRNTITLYEELLRGWHNN